MNEQLNSFESIGKENPFKVPPGYFENLTGRIMDQLPKEEESEPKVISLWSRIKPWAYAAAVVACLALATNLLIGTLHSSKPTLNLTSSSEIEEFYQYYDEQIANRVYHETLYLDESFMDEDIE
jgi:hypothetical protein